MHTVSLAKKILKAIGNSWKNFQFQISNFHFSSSAIELHITPYQNAVSENAARIDHNHDYYQLSLLHRCC
jgi:hypothetical protein